MNTYEECKDKLLGIIAQQLNWFHIIEIPDKKFGLLGVFVGLTGIYAIFRYRGKNKPLANLGYYAYGIYLFHVFGTAGSRIVSKLLGVESLFLLFLIGMLFGLGFPIILEKYILLKVPVLKRLFLGLR
jgi:peptidoglycan/LPS O-acetylase OafA/YrhL